MILEVEEIFETISVIIIKVTFEVIRIFEEMQVFEETTNFEVEVFIEVIIRQETFAEIQEVSFEITIKDNEEVFEEIIVEIVHPLLSREVHIRIIEAKTKEVLGLVIEEVKTEVQPPISDISQIEKTFVIFIDFSDEMHEIVANHVHGAIYHREDAQRPCHRTRLLMPT